MEIGSTPPAWLIAILVIFPLIGFCGLCYCAYRCCCAPGKCCGAPQAAVQQTQFEIMQMQQAQAAKQYPAGGGYPHGGNNAHGSYPPQAYGGGMQQQQAMPMGYSVQGGAPPLGSINGGGVFYSGSSVAPSAYGGYPQVQPQPQAQAYSLPPQSYALPQSYVLPQTQPAGYGGGV